MKVGMVGLDNSHCIIFAGMLNNPGHEYHVPGAQVVGGYRGGSLLFSLSRSRIDGFTQELTQQYGVTLYDSIEELAQDVDAILLESTDGRQHLEQFRRMAIGKPVYIDKPFTTSTAEAAEIIRLADKTHTPIMSCSSQRFAAGISDLLDQGEHVVSCEAFGYTPILEDYPGFFWYGVHSAEILFSFLGPGCGQVRCLPYKDTDVIIGEWNDGRVGVVRGTRFKKDEYGCVVHTEAGAKLGIAKSAPPTFFFLLHKILEFFKTGVSPFNIQETLGIVAFLEAANASKEQSGAIVSTGSL